MYDPINLSKTCPKCGETYFGTHFCPEMLKSDYDRGYDAGRESVYPKPILPLTKTCAICGQTYTGTHICPDLFKSDYDRGYDAGKKAARRELGHSGFGEFKHCGE
jgi:hypothetical protein